MEADSGIKLSSLKVDGGASANNLLMQIQSDIAATTVIRPSCIETTAMGAAYLAGLAVGYWNDRADVLSNWQKDKEFAPQITDTDRQERLRGWKKAVKCAQGWAQS